MEKMTASQTLKYIIGLLTYYLENDKTDNPSISEFIMGERTAFVECLEIIQLWKSADRHGLNFDIEARFPLSF